MKDARINEIDFLRFLAALAVVFFHYSFRGHASDSYSVLAYPAVAGFGKYGYLGVHLFFMISGFVILMTASSGSLRHFVASRAIRLYPAFWICCSLTFAATLWIGAPRFSATFGQFAVNLTMMSRFLDVPSIDGAYWSLFVEIKFYLIVAIVLIFRSIHRAEALLAFWVVATLACHYLGLRSLGKTFLIDSAGFFAAGCVCYLIWSKGLTRTRVLLLGLAWWLAVVRALQELPKFEREYQTPFDSWVVAALVTAFFAILLLVALKRTGALGDLRWPLLGAVTYPLYLLHQNIGYMIFNALSPRWNPHLLFWGTIALMIAAALAIHLCFEKPLARMMKRALAPRPSDRPATA